jgi:hypothetical protein
MRSYLVCSLVIVLLAAVGCGDDRPSVDARDSAGDRGDGGGADRADVGVDTGTDTGTDTPVDTGSDRADTGADTGDSGTDMRTDGGDGGDGGGDGGTPTCSDGIKNSDETGVDCGGHCGKCPPGGPCLVNADCMFACRADKTCSACNVAADCPGTETECEHRACTSGACGITREAAGTVLTSQTTGDCKRRQCAADGTVAVANDDGDLPVDGNPCTNDICTTGTPSHTMMPANSDCGGGNHCNAAGQCVGCTVATDCPGTDTACRTRTCTGDVCGFSYTAANTKLVDPTAGDCKGMQCDGQGNAQVFNDNTDLPVDTNACTKDECSMGTPSHRPEASGVACGGSLICDGASNCVECTSAPGCPGTDTECHTRTCIAGQCGVSNMTAGTTVTAQTPRDCRKTVCDGNGGTTMANDDLDLPVDGNACTNDICSGGAPSNPFVSAGTGCGSSNVCDGQGACVACVTASTCPGTDTECHVRTCVSGACGISNTAAGMALTTQIPGDCKRSQCDGAGQAVVVNDDNDKPVDGNACTNDICSAGVPSNPNLPIGTNCGPSLMCNGSGACVGCVTASDCGTNTTCQTHTCTNGQCGVVNTAAGTLLPSQAQTPGDCKKVQCDGAGQSQTVPDDGDRPIDTNQCTQDLCNAGIPSNPPENAGTACTQNGGIKCNGSGSAPACVQCLAVADCSGSDTECRKRTCSAAGVCGTQNVADGTALVGQSTGDCKKNVCMTGAPAVVNDDADPPVDGNGCTQDLCTSGTPSNPPQPSGTSCSENGGTRCNGSSACVQCLQASHCGTNNDCQTFACSGAGACSVSFVPNGTPVPGQIGGDCKRNVCNGSGSTVVVADNGDLPVDGNGCTIDQCTGGNPSNPPQPSGTSCNESGGTRCNGSPTTPACVQCLQPSHCGTDTVCKTFTCSAAGMCGSTNANDGTLVTNVPVGNCHKDVCMTGAITTVVDDSDVFVDGNLCTGDTCSGGVPSNPNQPVGFPCGTGQVCNGGGSCVGCLADSDCPLPPNACQTRVCSSGVCGFNNVAVDTLVTLAPLGDCHRDVCDGNGNVVSQIDNNDTPSTGGNQCRQSVCTNGAPSTPPQPLDFPCSQNNGTKCDGAGACVECVNASECPGGPDTECHARTCTTGLCGIAFANAGTPVSTQTSGDCQKNQCDGLGNVESVADDSDDPVNNNQCALTMCAGGAPMTTNVAHGTTCTQSNGRTCDGAGACILSVSVLKYLTTTANAVAMVIEERKVDATGTLVGTTTLPTTTVGANFRITGVGNSSSEGSLSLSGDGRYLIHGGYDAAVAAADPSASTTVGRVFARIDAAGGINTTTRVVPPPFTANNVRGVTSQDGTGFWAGGAGNTSSGGIWWIPLGATAGTQLTMASTTNVRWPHVIAGQLYTSGNSAPVFSPVKVGTGLPTTAGQTVTALPGLPTSGAAPFSFVFFDRGNPNVTGFDTLYIADGTAGVQRWTLAADGGNWTLSVPAFNISPAVGFRGLTAIETGANITLIATTTEVAQTRIVVFTDTGGTPGLGTVLVTAPTGQGYRGIALAPHL